MIIKKAKKDTIFVTDAYQRKAVAIVRSLGRKGLNVVSGESKPWSSAFFSKYCRKSYVYPDPREKPDAFIEWLIEHAIKGVFNVLFPIDEITMTPVTMHLERLSKYMIVPVIDNVTYNLAHDKSQTIHIAQECGISCPKTFFPENPDDLPDLLGQGIEAVVIKPRCSSGSRGRVYVKDLKNLSNEYKRINLEYPRPLVQEYIPQGGDTFGVGILMGKNSEVKAVFAHRRLREFPIDGGPSTLRESVERKDIVEISIKLLKKMNWYGVAMVEFKIDPRDGRPVLMEVNPKFWGSIALSIVAGVDFPYLLYCMSVNKEITPVLDYQKGILCRWLIPGDVLHFINNPNRFKLKPSFFNFRAKNLYDDIIDKDDMGPLFGLIPSFFSQILNRKFWKDLLR